MNETPTGTILPILPTEPQQQPERRAPGKATLRLHTTPSPRDSHRHREAGRLSPLAEGLGASGGALRAAARLANPAVGTTEVFLGPLHLVGLT